MEDIKSEISRRVGFMVACAAPPLAAPPVAETPPSLPNPASVHCASEGGNLEIRDEVWGQVDYCLFPDGSECEEWAFFKDECAPGDAGQSKWETDQVLALIQNGDFSDIVTERLRRASSLPDVSGLAWIADDTFLAVHDAKYPEEVALPRVSLLQLPRGLEGILWEPLAMPVSGPNSNDFESVARIPGTRLILLVESTEQQDEKPFSRRIFLAEIGRPALRIIDTIEWPIPTHNVEGTAVAQTGDDLGPFRSVIYIIGQVSVEEGTATVVLDPEPTPLGSLDGLKVESLAVRELPGVDMELYIGLDDEDYGGTLRKIVEPRS